MTIRLFAAVLAALSLSMGSAATAAIHGRQTEAPPWSFACMTDHGPSECREPMWVYGN
jgi:invasion protein IalB